MTHEEIIWLARDARMAEPYHPFNVWGANEEALERFAALVAAQEREECARVCDAKVKDEYATGLIDHHEIGWTESCAFAIRARGEEPKRHPGYIIGDHWLQAAYTRICTGETEDEVMTDYGWQRESR